MEIKSDIYVTTDPDTLEEYYYPEYIHSEDFLDEAGNLDLQGQYVMEIPDDMLVTGDLGLTGAHLVRPDWYYEHFFGFDLSVGGNLNIAGFQIDDLPSDSLTVGGDLDLQGTWISDLDRYPRVTVGGDLYLPRGEDCPAHWAVGGKVFRDGEEAGIPIPHADLVRGMDLSNHRAKDGSLLLNGARVCSLPRDLIIGGDLWLDSSRIMAETDDSDLRIPGGSTTETPDHLRIEGDVYLNTAKVYALPETLTVEGDLHLSCARIYATPKHLTIGGDLILECAKVWASPKNMTVAGDIHLEGADIRV